MNKMKRLFEQFSEPLSLFIIFWATQLPLRDFDIWFHIKAGEYFVQHGLTFVEPFSFAAQGREWIAFEWLFQIIAYELSRIGLWIIPPFISLFVVAISYIYLRTLKDIFKVPLIIRLSTLLLFIVNGYEFMTARPYMAAYTLLFLELSLILYRIFKGKRWILYFPLLVLVWNNIHSTAFLSWGMLASYAVIAGFQYLVTKNKTYLSIIRDFVLAGVICAVVTILPPMGIRDYRLLWSFFLDRKFLADFIQEWAPPFDNFLMGFIIYTGFVGLSTLGAVWISIKNRRWIENLWTVPFLITAFVGFSATRNVFLGLYSSMFLLGWVIPQLVARTPSRIKKTLWGILFILLISSQLFLYTLKHQSVNGQRLYYPIDAAAFAKQYLTGRMFNEYTYGGYMLYSVYPKLQIFLDGRAEVYHLHEMRDYLQLSAHKYLPDPQYRRFLNTFWDKYAFDFVIIGVQKHVVMRRIGSLLSTDPNWALVFWDDDSEIFVRRNGKNDGVIKEFETKAATPYLRDPFPSDKVDQAQFEYERMDGIAKSARTSNALGYIYELEGNLDQAKSRFVEATTEDPTFESPYMNLGEIAAHDGNIPAAISLYQKALSLAPDRGLIYIRLGQLTLEMSPDKRDEVRALWQRGVKNTVDTDAKTQLTKLLSHL